MANVALIRNSQSYDIGGAEIFPVNLAKILTSTGHRPYMLSSNKKNLELAESKGIVIKHSPWWSFQNFSGARIVLFPIYIFWMLFLSFWYLAYVLRNKIDVLHPQSRDDFIATTIAGKVVRKKVIWIDHADLKHVYANHQIWYKNPVGKLAYLVSRYADRVVLESHSEKRLIEKSLGKPLPANYVVTHIGVVDSYRSSTQKKGPITVVSTSRLVVDKGINELIEAMKLIDNNDVKLKICGDGPDAALFKNQAKGMGNIEFMGHVHDVSDVLRNADMLVHPTYHEGFGLSLVEAEMCGLPIIASDVGSIPEIVQDGVNGILVPVKNSKALATAINELSRDSQKRKKMGEASRRIYLENFQFDQIVSKHFIPLYN